MVGVLTEERGKFHRQLMNDGPLCISNMTVDKKKMLVASNADANQPASRSTAMHIAQALGAPTVGRKPGQTAGRLFESAVQRFLIATLPELSSVRPGEFVIENVGGKRNVDHVARYHPYRHLSELAEAVSENKGLQAFLGNSYVISPDILVLRAAETDARINSLREIVDDGSAQLSPFRASNSGSLAKVSTVPAFVHAVVSCKWTMRSDRSQNTRSEALNLIRNRKGRAPHIVAVTAEPSLSRIASLALGTGDIDMVYHAFLPELASAIEATGNDDSKEMMEMLVNGQRLRDIADLPLDLAI